MSKTKEPTIKTRLYAVGKRILVRMPNTKKTASGIILPDGSKMYQDWVTVLDPGYVKNLNAGDRVFIISNMAQPIEGYDDTYWCHAEHVVAVELDRIKGGIPGNLHLAGGPEDDPEHDTKEIEFDAENN